MGGLGLCHGWVVRYGEGGNGGYLNICLVWSWMTSCVTWNDPFFVAI